MTTPLSRPEVEVSKQNPAHYRDHPENIECIQITRWMNFNVGNATKYLFRAGRKRGEDTLDDLEKATWYVNDEIQRVKRMNLRNVPEET